jgi:hypothetical protein
MKKLSINELEATVGGGKLRTCLLAGIFTAWGVGIAMAGSPVTAGTFLVGSLAAANYNGCLD